MNHSFDSFAAAYDEALHQGLRITGGDRSTYAKYRVGEFKNIVAKYKQNDHFSILDFGCGDGATSLLLSKAFNADVIGVDLSKRSIEMAIKNSNTFNNHVRFIPFDDFKSVPAFDLAYCNGVYHHIPLEERGKITNRIYDSLRPGGLFAVFENNPWNPGTRLVMSRIPFDRDAIVVTPPEMKRVLIQSGFHILTTKFLFFIPPFTGPLFTLDRYCRWFPLGGQYLIIGQKS